MASAAPSPIPTHLTFASSLNAVMIMPSPSRACPAPAENLPQCPEHSSDSAATQGTLTSPRSSIGMGLGGYGRIIRL
eukprot:1101849-Amorphochlora_amoeboformis.AAC.1